MEPRDEIGERTEKATDRRLQRAREEGNVPRSGELSAIIVLLAACALLGALGPLLLRQLTQMTAALLRGAGAALDAGSLRAGALEAAGPAIATVGVLLGGICGAAFLSGVAQVGLRAVARRCRADMGRLRPADGLRRMFSRRGCVRAVMSVCKLAAVAVVAFVTIRSSLVRIGGLAGAGPAGIAGVVGTMLAALALRVGLVLLVLAGVDYLYQRWEHRQDLKMTRRELTEERKETEGDPATRLPARQARKRRRERSAGRAVDGLREI